MSTRQLERDTVEAPTVNPWREKPTGAQLAYAADLCRSELPYAERVATIASFAVRDRTSISALIDTLTGVRKRRLARLRKARRGQRR
jgi:hypothetical protein